MPLYFFLLIGSVSLPLLFTLFYKDVVKNWKYLLISTSLIAFVFIVWDVLFTRAAVWGFNHDYTLGLNIFQLPLEEWLFFFIIPFCSLFIHFALIHTYPRLKLNKLTTGIVTCIVLVLAAYLVITNYTKSYTLVNFMCLAVVLIIGLWKYVHLLQQFLLSYVIIIIPFIIVNGTLTGNFTPHPIVWYNDVENLGIRFLTIPVEDFGYAFTMLFGNLMIYELLNQNKKRNVSVS
jgi:lycopene cyclase domain-containing protein